MRIILAANESIGYKCLEILLAEKQQVIGVITNKSEGELSLINSRIISLANQCGIKLYQPESLNDPTFVAEIATINPDLIINIAYLQIYKRPILEVPSFGCVNFHPGPLPKYAGLHPWIWAIINGEQEYGIAFHYMAEKIDSGDIISSKRFNILKNDTGLSLLMKCYQEGAVLFKETLNKIINKSVKPIRQDVTKRTYFPKEIPNNGVINVQWSSKRIVDFVRALTFTPLPNPLAPPVLKINNEKFIIEKATSLDNSSLVNSLPGQISDIREDGMVMRTGSGSVLLKLSTGAKNDMQEFCAVKKIQKGSILGDDRWHQARSGKK